MTENTNIKIGNFEVICIMIILICTKIVLNFPRRMADDGWTAGWILAIYISFIAFIIFYIFLRLLKPFDNKDILDISSFALGKFGEIFLGLILILELIIFASVKLREFAENMKVITLKTTPISVVTIMFCLGMIVSAYLGLEAIARINGLLVPYVAANFIFILLALSEKYDISKIAPWFGPGLNQIFIKNAKDISSFAEFGMIFLMIPFLKKKNDLKKVGRHSLLISSIFLISSAFSFLLVYQYPSATIHFLPLYNMARGIMIGTFFARMESAFMFFWAPVAFSYLGIILYFTTYIFKKIFNLEYYRPLIIPVTVIIYVLSLLPEHLDDAIQFEGSYLSKYAWIPSFLIPFFFLVIANVKKKRTKTKKEVR